ncbi:hypothetical protein LINPERHAP1_LOCUS969 [Linum perenne]
MRLKCLASYISELALMENMLQYPLPVVAASSIFVAMVFSLPRWLTNSSNTVHL